MIVTQMAQVSVGNWNSLSVSGIAKREYSVQSVGYRITVIALRTSEGAPTARELTRPSIVAVDGCGTALSVLVSQTVFINN